MRVASCSKQLKVRIHTCHHPTIKLSRSPPVRIGQGATGIPHSFFWLVAHLSRAGDTGQEKACLLAAQPLEEREQVEELARMLWAWK